MRKLKAQLEQSAEEISRHKAQNRKVREKFADFSEVKSELQEEVQRKIDLEAKQKELKVEVALKTRRITELENDNTAAVLTVELSRITDDLQATV
jgi:hypothetical protein